MSCGEYGAADHKIPDMHSNFLFSLINLYKIEVHYFKCGSRSYSCNAFQQLKKISTLIYR